MYRKCPAIIKEIEILKIKEKHDISYLDAKLIEKTNVDKLGNKKSSNKSFDELLLENENLINELDKVRKEKLEEIQEKSKEREKVHHYEHAIIPQLKKEIAEQQLKINQQDEKLNQLVKTNDFELRRIYIRYTQNRWLRMEI